MISLDGNKSKSETLLEERLDHILSSAKWYHFINQLLGLIPYASSEEIKKGKRLKFHWLRYASIIILSLLFTSYTMVKLIRDSDFSKISMLIALTLCAMTVIQNITLINIFGALTTKYYKMLAETDVFLINNVAISDKSYKILQQKDMYMMMYNFISVVIRQTFAANILKIDYFQSFALFVSAFINCYVKFVFISLSIRISQRFSKLNCSISLLGQFPRAEKMLVKGK